MTTTIDAKSFEEDFNEIFTDTTINLPNTFWKYIEDNFWKNHNFNFTKSFKLDFVVDTNILYKEVRSLMLNNSSFFLKVFDCPLIKVYAPSKIKTELLAKIRIKFPKDKKTKNLDINICIEKAEELLDKIIISDEIDIDSYESAKSTLENRDIDDIDFLGLTLSLKADGILTADKDLKEQDLVETWILRDAGKLVCDIKKGNLSLMILGFSTLEILKILFKILSYLWFNILKKALIFLELTKQGVSSGLIMLSKIPKVFLWILLGTSTIGYLHPKSRDFMNDIFKFTKEKAIETYRLLKQIVNEVYEVFKTLFNFITPFLKSFKDVFMYLLKNTSLIMTRIPLEDSL